MGIVEQAVDKMKTKLDDACEHGAIGSSERMLSVIAGGFILGYSVKKLLKKPLRAISGVTLGGALIARGITGRCPVKGALENAEEEERNLTLIERRYFEK
ncbi:DUF2892 domain-containing protein [Sphingobacterium phlebotomi]|uniref:DUF2892 domain-containing protein n=1 Tax=Sphingobacterium phlebotomi TaxID=2605433 RepID=A0A5D4GT49_9SPHI|nr:DUF2892 domain-containing protein [Sphingobacterium phlebotomi]TYR31304.1 DUF2892 domain-containing protein [Sphingobacterium phlebotomi]